MVSKAAAGRAAELEQARDLNRDVRRDAKAEESIIKSKIEALKRVYKDKTPKALLIDPATGQKYPPMKRQKILFDTGNNLAKFFSILASIINPMLEKDLGYEKKLGHLFSSSAQNMGTNLVLLKRIKTKQKLIKDTLLAWEIYWTSVRDTSHKARLPLTHPVKNGKRIVEAVEFIDQLELGLIAQMEKGLSKGRVRLLKSGY